MQIKVHLKTSYLMVIQVLNSKLGITLRVSVTSTTILTAKLHLKL